ncbi:MAG: hypothetical protein AABW75_03030 [Nanoarchaeota archaeon]
MEEITIEVDVPSEFKQEFNVALARVVKELVNELELAIAKKIISESKFTEKDAEELSEKVKLSMHNDLKKKGLI